MDDCSDSNRKVPATKKLPRGSKAATALTFEREVPCASLHKDEAKMNASTSLDLSSSVATQSDMPATSVTKKKAKKKAMSLSSAVGANITEEQLSAQNPSNIPKDWKTPGKYHPVCVAIWKTWLNFVAVFLDKQMKDGSILRGNKVIGLLMHYMPTQLTNSVKGDLHPASAECSNGSLRSNCWELVRQSVGERLYEKQCVKMNLSPWAHPYNGKRTDIFSMEDSLMKMESYQVFLLLVFNTVARTHLCSQVVQNQVTALYGGKAAFREYVKTHQDMFFLALEDYFQTCCHPEFLINKQYKNAYTKGYAKVWDEIYSKIRSFFGNPDKCTQANNIIIELDGSVLFELRKRAAEENDARTTKRLIDLAERGEHP